MSIMYRSPNPSSANDVMLNGRAVSPNSAVRSSKPVTDGDPVVPERQHPAGHEVGEEVRPVQRGAAVVHGGAAVHVPAGDRLADAGRVGRSRRSARRCPAARRLTSGSRSCPPAGRQPKLLPAGRPVGDEVDLLPAVLPDVADVQVAGLPVEAGPVRVPQPVRVQLRPTCQRRSCSRPGWRTSGSRRTARCRRRFGGSCPAGRSGSGRCWPDRLRCRRRRS